MMTDNFKYKDKDHKPIPMFGVGDVVYTTMRWLSFPEPQKQVIRRVTVTWDGGSDLHVPHWDVAYRIKGYNSDWYEPGDSNYQHVYPTYEDALKVNARDFIDYTRRKVEAFGKISRQLGIDNPLVSDSPGEVSMESHEITE